MASPSVSDELGFLARRNLSTILDSDSSQDRNWIGLAGQMGFSYSTVVRLREARSTHSPTIALLEAWQAREGTAASLDSLVSMLSRLGNKEAADIVKDVIAKKTLSKEKASEAETSCSGGAKDNTSSSSHIGNAASASSKSCSKDPVTRTRRFDVFLSYAEEDEEFAEEMRTRFAQENLRVFIPSEGFMEGKVFHQEIASTIKKDCWRTVVILSPSYLTSPWCAYEADLSIIKSPDVALNVLVPVLYKSCGVPPFISHLHYLDYTRYQGNKEKCERCFWKKLVKCVSMNPTTPFN